MIKFLSNILPEDYLWLGLDIIIIVRCLYILTLIILFLLFGIELYICRKKNLKLRISNIIVCFLSGAMLFLMFGMNNSMSMKNNHEVFELLSQVEITDEVKTFFSLLDDIDDICYPKEFYNVKSSAEYVKNVDYNNDKKRANLYAANTSLIEFSSNDEAQSAFKYMTKNAEKYLHTRIYFDTFNINKDFKLYKLSDGTEYMLSDLSLIRDFFVGPLGYEGNIVFVKNNYVIIVSYSYGCNYDETYFLSIPVKPNRKTLMKNIENTIMDTLINPVADPDDSAYSEY